jgi:GTP-binding protein Era
VEQTTGTFRAGFVTLVGEPNVGKSTLMNALVGEKLSIVTPKPQTTRHRVLGILSDPSYQIVFCDTPGIITPRYALQEAMMRTAASALADADVVLLLLDGSRVRRPEEEGMADLLRLLRSSGRPVVLGINKTDLASAEEIGKIPEIFAGVLPMQGNFAFSAKTSAGVAELKAALVALLPEHPPYYPLDIVSEQNQRFFVSEMIREKIFLTCHDEVPYSATVEIVEFQEREQGKWFISADITVERDSQKGIVIGAHGAKLKEIGLRARRDIERFLDHPVFLDLHVRVREGWRGNEEWLRRLGYTS